MRLTRQYDRLTTGDGTSDTEDVLDWEPHAYFSIDCSYPEYGEQVVVFTPVGAFAERTKASPFDTGGMLSEQIALQPGVDDSVDGRRDVVERWTLPFESAAEAFPAWVNGAYASAGRYEMNQAPDAPYATDVLLGDDTDSRAWSWEARILIDEGLTDLLEARCVYLTPLEWKDYGEWVRNQYPADAEDHLDSVAAIAPTVEHPVARMRNDLRMGTFL